jgi:hypothetical protein
MEKVLKLDIQIPTTPEGVFDLAAQHQLAEKHAQIELIRSAITQKLDRVSGVHVALE